MPLSPLLRSSVSALALCASPLGAAITYIDATSANTTGSAFVTTGQVYTDGLWTIRSVTADQAVGATVFEAGPERGSEHVPVIATSATGLMPGAVYELYAYFLTLPTTDGTQLWRMRAGPASNALGAYDRESADTSVLPDGSTTVLVDPAGNGVAVPATRDYRQAYVGLGVADATGKLTVFVDSGLGTSDAGHRTWYDGIGYQLSSTGGSGPSPVVDAASGVVAAWSTEWNTAGASEGWTPSGGTLVVAGGAASLAATGTTPSLTLSGFSGGPDLDLGFNDYLEVRVRVPAGYTGPMSLYHGASGSTGFTGNRCLVVPASTLVKDGAFHTYRLDLGLEVFWRGTLRDLRIEFPGADATGRTFDLDSVRVGDEPGARVYQARVSGEAPVVGGTITVDGVVRTVVGAQESKHFRYVWDSTVAAHASWTSTLPRNTLRNLEEMWQVYVRKIGYREPCFATGTTSGTAYKVNVTSWYAGYWAGMDGSYGRLNITPDGLRENPPSGVLSHELMHVFQFHNTTGYVPGSWWEGHANYGRERHLQHFRGLYPSNQRSGIDPTYLRCGHQAIAHGRDYYLSWPFFLYLDENPDGLADLGEGTVAKLWQQTQLNEHPLTALERLTPTSTVQDIAGGFARRQVTMDYTWQADLNAALAAFGAPLDSAASDRWRVTDLVQRPDQPTWWRVPFEMAPMQGAYTVHELVPTGTGAGRVVAVTLRGLADSARGAGWRASLVAIADDGTERYGPLWASGRGEITLGANENRLYLAVAGAPASFHVGAPNASFEGDFDEAVYPYRSAPSKSRFPYELQVEGGAPKVRDNGVARNLVQHANGGGYKASTATVATTAYIGPNARVLGTANVSGTARIEDYALVSGAAVISGAAIVSGHAWVRGGTVTGNAKVRDWALVEGGTLSGNARVLEHGNFKGGSATDLVTVKGSAGTLSGALTGNAILDGDYGDFFSGRDVANAVAFGHQPYVGVPDSFLRGLTTGIYASYDFGSAHDSRVLDQPGVTDGFTVGAPVWVAADAARQGFLTFDGTGQSVLLDRSVADLRDFTFTAWVKPLGGPGGQPIVWLGATPTRRLVVTADDGTGRASFSIVNGGAEQTLSAAGPLLNGVWSQVAVTLNSATGLGAFYVNGTLVASGAITIRPDQLLAANTADGLQHNYLGRSEGTVRPFFRGALDGVRFYGMALSAADVAALQPLAAPTAAGTLYVDLRADDASAGAATWVNRAGAGDFARTGAPAKVANVLNTGIPGVQFSGSGQAYTGPVTTADLDGASDRTIEAWVYNPSITDEESLVSWSYRGTSGRAMSFNYGSASTYNAVTHWGGNYDLSWGAVPAAGAWHHLVYTYDGSLTARVYVDGVLSATKTLPAVLATFVTQPINLACQRDTASGTRSKLFSGYLNTVRVHGGVLSATQVAGNYQLGPSGKPANQAPTLTGLGDLSATYGTTNVVLPFTIGDGDTSLSVLSVYQTTPVSALLPSGSVVVSGTGASRSLTLSLPAGVSGVATLSVSVSDGRAVTTRTFTLTVSRPSDTWRLEHFGTALADGDAADDADPDGDGLVNQVEFFLGSLPLAYDGGAAQPMCSEAGGYLTFTYTRSRAAAIELAGVVEWSDSLVAPVWSNVDVTETVVSEDAVVQRIEATIPVGAASRFVRLRVAVP